MLAFASLILIAAQADPAKEMMGSYTLKEYAENGVVAPLLVIQNYQECTVGDGELVIRTTAGPDTAKFVLDSTKKIPEIDFASPTSGDKTTSPGIYKFEKGVLTIVYRKGGGVRPSDFRAKDEGLVRLVLEKRPAKK